MKNYRGGVLGEQGGNVKAKKKKKLEIGAAGMLRGLFGKKG